MDEKATQLRDLVDDFPTASGVYLMKNGDGDILYIGKAKNLRARVLSYFRRDCDKKTRFLMRRVSSIEHIVTGNEYEALLLESNLIKQWQPFYNIDLKDSKSYPVIRITNERYPRVFLTRRIVNDGSHYWGPYTKSGEVARFLELIESIYPLRKCRGPVRRKPRPCLYHHIGRCSAPCANRIDRDAYLRNIDGIRRLLNGKTSSFKRELRRQIKQAGAELRFEKAAELRDIIRALEQFEVEQWVIDFNPDARDVIGYAEREHRALFVLFRMREGKLVDSASYFSEAVGTPSENLTQFILQYYGARASIPASLQVPVRLEESEIGRFFLERCQREIEIVWAPEERYSSLMRLAMENARYNLIRRLRESGNSEGVAELEQTLDLPGPPLLIEGFDIAHVEGKHTVASMVQFRDGAPKTNQYRHYTIRSLQGKVDDFESIREVVARRYTKVIAESLPMPDLLLIDGGLGQVNAAKEILDSLDLHALPLVGLAKRNEELYLPGRSEPLVLPHGSEALRLLQYVRNEAHRFATQHRARRQRGEIGFGLLRSIPGIGEHRARRLLECAGSLAALAEMSPTRIADGCGIGVELAGAVRKAIRKSLDRNA